MKLARGFEVTMKHPLGGDAGHRLGGGVVRFAVMIAGESPVMRDRPACLMTAIGLAMLSEEMLVGARISG